MADKRWDVLVAGAGPGGLVAALAAARNGANVVLIEASSAAGGVATAAQLSTWGPFDNADRRKDFQRMRLCEQGRPWTGELLHGERIIKGLPEELLSRLVAADGAIDRGLGFIPLNPETLKRVADQMLMEAGVELMLFTSAVDMERADDVWIVRIVNKAGISQVRAKVIVDASGDADLAARAGAQIAQGRESDGKVQGVTLMFRVGNANISENDTYDPQTIGAFKEATGGKGLGCWNPLPGQPGVFAINCQHTWNVDGTDPTDLSHAMINGRREIAELVDLYRKHLSGCESLYLIDTAPMVGVRETRRIVGDYVLTEKDIISARKFTDAICRNAYNLDVHMENESPLTAENAFVPTGQDYDIPYRCLLPKGVENLLVAGRPISTTHLAHSSTRIMPCCMAVGQGAGTAAALSATQGCGPRQLDVKRLRHVLRTQGVCLHPDDCVAT